MTTKRKTKPKAASAAVVVLNPESKVKVAKGRSSGNLVVDPDRVVEQSPGNYLELAIKNNAPIETIERLAKLLEEFRAKKAFRAFHDAMTGLQSTLPVIPHNKTGDSDKYSYADLGQIIRTVGPNIAAAGFSYRFEFKDVTNAKIQDRKDLIEEIIEAVKGFNFERDKVYKLEKILIDILLTKEIEVTCVVTHREGHSERTTMTGPEDHSGSKNAIQSRGSSTTYLERYALIGSFGLVTADSDPDGRKKAKDTKLRPDDKKAKQPDPTPQKPAMTDEEYKKAFHWIAVEHKNSLQGFKDRFTLTEVQLRGLESADETRKKATEPKI